MKGRSLFLALTGVIAIGCVNAGEEVSSCCPQKEAAPCCPKKEPAPCCPKKEPAPCCPKKEPAPCCKKAPAPCCPSGTAKTEETMFMDSLSSGGRSQYNSLTPDQKRRAMDYSAGGQMSPDDAVAKAASSPKGSSY